MQEDHTEPLAVLVDVSLAVEACCFSLQTCAYYCAAAKAWSHRILLQLTFARFLNQISWVVEVNRLYIRNEYDKYAKVLFYHSEFISACFVFGLSVCLCFRWTANIAGEAGRGRGVVAPVLLVVLWKTSLLVAAVGYVVPWVWNALSYAAMLMYFLTLVALCAVLCPWDRKSGGAGRGGLLVSVPAFTTMSLVLARTVFVLVVVNWPLREANRLLGYVYCSVELYMLLILTGIFIFY